MFRNLKTKVVSGVALAGAGIGSVLAADSAIATAAKDAIDTSKADALSVGGAVVTLVAGLVVVGIIIALVKKT